MMPRVSVCMTDRDGNVTEFTVDRSSILVADAAIAAPKIKSVIKALFMWEEFIDAFLKERIAADGVQRMIEIRRDKFIKENPEEAARAGI